MSLSPTIKAQLRTELATYHNSLWKPPLNRELEFLDRTVSSLNNIRISTRNQAISSRCKRIHLSPKVRFFRTQLPTPSPTTTELSDLIFVYKHIVNGVLKDYRAILAQTKFTSQKRKTWHIDTNQFFLMTQWPRFKIVSPAKFKCGFHIRPKSRTWSTYGFVGPLASRFPIYFSSSRILQIKSHIPSTKSFSFSLKPLSGWDSSPSFFMKCLQGLIGENLLKNKPAFQLIRTLYILAEWEVDPSDELEWNSEKIEDDKGFGIIEFTVRTEE